jgi:hypothetical protein
VSPGHHGTDRRRTVSNIYGQKRMFFGGILDVPVREDFDIQSIF